jgi:ABC-2 type transport system ATP-binding protein
MSILEIKNLRKTYGATVAVDDVSFSVEEGEVFGILGPNGAGKTTTVECIEGLRRRDGGEIRVLGRDPDHDHQTLTRVVGAQLQESGLQDRIRVREALELFASLYDDAVAPDDLLEELHLDDVAATPYAELSGGQKKRLSIALALVGRPRIAILDELTTGLDPVGRREVWSLVERIRERGVTVLLVTHFMEEAERLCDRLAVIDRGRVVALDTPSGMVDRLSGRQVLRFRLTQHLDPRLLAGLSEVRDVRTHETALGSSAPGTTYVITGTDRMAQAVMTTLTREGALAHDLRLDRASLDDAFVALVGEDVGEAMTIPKEVAHS